jgi:hypothetical protein
MFIIQATEEANKVIRNQQVSLFVWNVSDDEKKFYNVDARTTSENLAKNFENVENFERSENFRQSARNKTHKMFLSVTEAPGPE